jgi:deoxyadenosine/deoxycytidine kinase
VKTNQALPYSYIAIEGNIGAGKTSLAKIVSNKFNADLVMEEFAENTFLPQFYENPDRFAFPLEMSFLAERYQQLKQQQEISFASKKLLVTDYIFEKSLLFAQVNLKGHELELFKKFFNLINNSLRKPDLILYLNKSTPQLLDNISKRGRNYEKSIPSNYLDKITEQYLEHLNSIKDERILILDSNNIDFVGDSTQLRIILELLNERHPSAVKHIKTV